MHRLKKLAGPRIGVTYITAGPIADFIHDGFDFDEDDKFGSTVDQLLQHYMVGNGNQDLQMVEM